MQPLLSLALTICAILLVLSIVEMVGRTEQLAPTRGPDGRTYKVRDTAGSSESAAALARINARLSMLIHRLQLEGDPQRMGMIMRMAQRYNCDALSEGILAHDKTSYTVNKGEEVVMCLRSRDVRDELYDDNKLMYVAVHELAHIASVSTEHGEEFLNNMHFLERKAHQLGLLKPISESWEYCGLLV